MFTLIICMKILIACEESQRVCIDFRRKGHWAFSCDIEPCSGGHPEWHIKDDVLPLLNGNCAFRTSDGKLHLVGKWDVIIAFPPCTYLTTTGNSWFNVEKYGDKAIDRMKRREMAVQFFFHFVNADCERIAIENPVGIMSTRFRKPDQIIQPWMFGDSFEKRTCLWLKGLPCLTPSNVVDIPPRVYFESGRSMPSWYADCWNLPKSEIAKIRSKTFPGIAQAMADQWDF